MSQSESNTSNQAVQDANAAIETVRQIRREKNTADARAGKLNAPRRESAQEYADAVRKIEAVPPVSADQWLRERLTKGRQPGGL
jgi:hypothetical protein